MCEGVFGYLDNVTYIPEHFSTNEAGETEDRINLESVNVGQWTRRLRLPNGSRPNHIVFDFS